MISVFSLAESDLIVTATAPVNSSGEAPADDGCGYFAPEFFLVEFDCGYLGGRFDLESMKSFTSMFFSFAMTRMTFFNSTTNMSLLIRCSLSISK